VPKEINRPIGENLTIIIISTDWQFDDVKTVELELRD
jgi:hypothetical protein